MARGIKTGGRQRGTPNKITRAFREAVQTVYHDIGGDQAFAQWARENPSEFYRIAARLIPVQVNGPDDRMGLTFNVILMAQTPVLELGADRPALSAP